MRKKKQDGEKLIKTKERVGKYGEVFTPSHIVKQMCDMADKEGDGACSRIDSKILEPACGVGNFLVEILDRKLAECQRLYGDNAQEYTKHILQALTTLYGVDILLDNVETCRGRLFLRVMRRLFKVNKTCRKRFYLYTEVYSILHWNIICGNFLTHKQVDQNAKDKDAPLLFAEWQYDEQTRDWNIKGVGTLEDIMESAKEA